MTTEHVSVPRGFIIELESFLEQLAKGSTGKDALTSYQQGWMDALHGAHGLLHTILSRATPSAPIPMVLHCPSCGLQHIDAPSPGWDNPPHKSHLCHGCGSVWRPADVETTGVERIESQGKNDGLKTITQTVTDTVVAAYVSAVNSHLGSLTEKDWEIERFDPVASIHRVARIGLTAAFAQSRGAVVPHGWIGEVECCDAKGMWLIMSDNCALIPGQKVRIWVDDSMAAPSAPRVVTDEDVDRAMRASGDAIGGDYAGMRAALESFATSLPAARVPDGWTERHDKVQRFALRRFAGNARERADVAAQDKDGRHFNVCDVEKFLEDAKTADECLAMLAAAPQEGKRG